MKAFMVYYKQTITGCLEVPARDKEEAQEIVAGLVMSAEPGDLPEQKSDLRITSVVQEEAKDEVCCVL